MAAPSPGADGVGMAGRVRRGGGPNWGDTLRVGQREEELVARKGRPQEVQPGPGGDKTYIYTTQKGVHRSRL